jgi:hypothetical protein
MLPLITSAVVEVDYEFEVAQCGAEVLARGLPYVLEVAGFADLQAQGALEDWVGFMVKLLACEYRPEDLFGSGEAGRVGARTGMALATCWIEEPVAILARERSDGYILEAQGPDEVAYLSREGEEVV